jgi:hypothetical protein
MKSLQELFESSLISNNYFSISFSYSFYSFASQQYTVIEVTDDIVLLLEHIFLTAATKPNLSSIANIT